VDGVETRVHVRENQRAIFLPHCSTTIEMLVPLDQSHACSFSSVQIVVVRRNERIRSRLEATPYIQLRVNTHARTIEGKSQVSLCDVSCSVLLTLDRCSLIYRMSSTHMRFRLSFGWWRYLSLRNSSVCRMRVRYLITGCLIVASYLTWKNLKLLGANFAQ
jgi:hypothetical protein